MSVATEITRIQNAKNDLKTAINTKTDLEHQITDETIDDYADFVDSIETGGGGATRIDDCSYFFYTGVRLDEFEDLLPSINSAKIGKYMFSNISTKPSDFNTNLAMLNTSQMTDMSYMFNTNTLKNGLDVSNFITNNVTTMNNMFSNNGNVTSISLLDLSNFNTNNVTDMSHMFNAAYLSGNLNLSNFSTSINKTVNMQNTFSTCMYLSKIILGALRPNNLYRCFNGVGNNLSSGQELVLDVSNLDTSQCTSFEEAFGQCTKLKTLDLSNIDTSNALSMYGTFDGNTALTSLTLSPNFVTNKVTTMQLMFRDCYSLTSLNLSTFNTSKVTTMTQMFSNCRNITNLDLSSFTTEALTQVSNMFQNCYKLEELDLSNFNFTTRMTFFSNMFANCGTQTADGLTKVYVKDTDAQNWILTKSNGKPNTWSTANVIVAGSSDDLRNQ